MRVNLKSWSDHDLLNRAQTLAASERKIIREVIETLEEIESRKLYLERGYPSMYAFCTECLGYSPGSAQRRIESMRLIKRMDPAAQVHVKEGLASGRLNLTQLSQVSQVARAEKYAPAQALELLKSVEALPPRESEKTVLAVRTQPVPQREIRQRSGQETRVSLTLDEETMALL